MSKITRRQALSVTGLTLGAGGFAAGFADSSPIDGEFKPRYAPISPEKAAALAYEIFPQGACMYAVVKSVIELVAEEDSASVPPVFFDMFKYGHGGCGAWGALCGTCNGGSAAIGLFHQDKEIRDGMIARLLRWYETTQLPCYTPGPNETEPFPRAAAESVLCHMSVDSWCKAADAEPFNAKQKERCRRLSADVARKVAEILNDRYREEHSAQKTKQEESAPQHCPASQSPQSCIDYHSTPNNTQVSAAECAPKSIAKMNCASCHEMTANHPE